MMESVRIRDVERALGELRAATADHEEAYGLRTSVMSHVAWVPERWVEEATKTLGGLAERHPSRTILLFPRPDDDRDALDADVDLRCFAAGRGTSVCFEVVQLRLCGERASHPASVVTPLLVTDLPAFLRWRGPLPFGASELELVAVADRLIVDSREWEDPEADLARLAHLFDRIAVSDIAWRRLEPWRVALARRWPDIGSVETLRVAGPWVEATLLASWLGARLYRDVDLEHEPAGDVELVAADGEEVTPVGAGPGSSSDLLSAELDVFGRDLVYEEAVRSFSQVPT